MNGQELIASLTGLLNDKDGIGSFGHEDVSKEIDAKIKEQLGEYELVEEDGGHEGGGEDVNRVWHFKQHDVYVRLRGSYYSYDGTTWNDSFTQAYAKQEMVTNYYDQPQ